MTPSPLLHNKKGTRQANRDAGEAYRHSFTIMLLITLLIACGSQPAKEVLTKHENHAPTTQLIKPSDQIFSIHDLESAGLKHSKDYKTEGLPSATGVSLFFWKVDAMPVQYEVRFYSSHDEAVSTGTSYAVEGAGPEAIIDPDFARYKEGLRDRRTIVHTRGSPTPRYGDFVIYGNMIALCEGRDAEQGSQRCAKLVEALDPVRDLP